MAFMQSEEGMAEWRKFVIPPKTIAAATSDEGALMFKVFVTDEDSMKNFVSGKNALMKPIYDECIES